LQYVSDLRSLKFISRHVQEETEHYAAVAELYRSTVGESVEPWVREKLATKPDPLGVELPRSWGSRSGSTTAAASGSFASTRSRAGRRTAR
jgi:hypothetical protein